MPQTPPTQREYWNSKVGEQWVLEADRMDRTLAPMTRAAFDALKLQPGERVLDIGCGAGATTLTAARSVGATGHIVGVDISQPLLELARHRAAEAGAAISFVEADAGVGDIPGAPFDAAFSRFGVMFFTDTTVAFANIRRALRPGGRLVFVCWRTFEENRWSAAAVQALAPILVAPAPPADPNLPGPFALQDPVKIKTVLGDAGWRDVLIAPWDGDVLIGGGGSVEDAAAFLLKIGPCARVIAEQGIDVNAARSLLLKALAPHAGAEGVSLPAACWIVRATA